MRSSKGNLAEIELEGGHLEVVEGIHLVGEEAPSFPVDSLLHAAWEEEIRRIQQLAQSGDKMAGHYVGGVEKALE